MRRFAAVVAAALCAAAPAGATASWRTVPDPAAGFAIGVPSAWRVVPRSTAELNALVARLGKRRQTALATQYAEVAAARRVSHVTYRFQAFAWPPPRGHVVPDVTVKTDALTPTATQASLPLIAREIVKALAGKHRTTASAPVRRTLPAGKAVAVTGTVQLTKTLRSRYAIYLLIRGRTLYSISFRGPRTPAESRIVRSFRFT